MNADTQTIRNAAGQLNGQKEKLVDDIRTVVTDAETLLKQAKSTGAESYAAVRAQLEDKLAETVVRLQEVQEELKFRARYAARATDEYVHENPWKSIGIVAAAGIVVGLLLSRR
ncbi:MAG TPA: DUF883 family protein [Burkholderiales bacterium]|jgi:ElaB/YqjD/DUF883 family membrane-anchored ribosome-binding protein